MKKLFQSVSLVLALLLLAPPVWATMQCAHHTDETTSCKPCCADMDGMPMPMDDTLQSSSTAQLTESPCCIVTQLEAAIPASFSEDEHVLPSAFAPVLAVDLLASFTPIPMGRSISPPQAAPPAPLLSRLCSFLI
jgi:hypothetical protein